MAIVIIRNATSDNVKELAILIKDIIESLRANNKYNWFEPLQEEEIRQIICSAYILLSFNIYKELTGFLVLVAPTELELMQFNSEFEDVKKEGTLLIRTMGVAPKEQQGKIATLMIQEAREFIKAKGVNKIIGYLHPKNEVYAKTLRKIAYDEESFFIGKSFKTLSPEGIRCLKQRFLIKL